MHCNMSAVSDRGSGLAFAHRHHGACSSCEIRTQRTRHARRSTPYTRGVQPVSKELVDEAARRLGEAARKPARVILFGSYARGEAEATSDLDFLVVQKDGFSRRREIVRLQEALSPLRVPAEVLVIDHEEAEKPERAGDAVR